MAGPGSERFFRDNFKNRLAEALRNLERLWNNGRLDLNECMFYLEIFNRLRQRESNLPMYLINSAKKLSTLIAKG